jgi:hypothetical protein
MFTVKLHFNSHLLHSQSKTCYYIKKTSAISLNWENQRIHLETLLPYDTAKR